MLKYILIFLTLEAVVAYLSCPHFKNVVESAKQIYNVNKERDRILQNQGFLLSSVDIGFEKNRQSVCNASNYWKSGMGKTANVLTTTAMLLNDKQLDNLATNFESYSSCYGRDFHQRKSHPKFRTISGYGNNLKNPYWGMAGTAFARFGGKNYEDSIYSLRKSVTGNDLPNPRKLVEEVLKKATKYPRVSNDPNELLNFLILMITHDVAFQVPMEASNNCKEIRCCESGNRAVLPPELQHSACMPVQIPDDDPFYKDTGVKCLNMQRSETVSSPAKIQYGEILNKVTHFLDLSIVYGSEDAEARKIRSCSGGKLNTGTKNFLPTDINGQYTSIANRLTSVIQSAIWPVLFARNHNTLCDSLKAVNPNWNDERLYQEARRINIAIFQKAVLEGGFIESVAKRKVNETYSETRDPSTFLEFTTGGYRFLHYYLNSNATFQTSDNIKTEIPLSDTFGKIDLAEDNFDDLLRGALNKKLNFFEYSPEITNRFAKNSKDIGLDVISFDIQRARDHGLPSYMDARRKCGFKVFETFDDLIEIFPQNNVELLKNAYESVEDIDLSIGGALETFLVMDKIFLGETFGCVVGENYRNLMGGDSYFFSHPTNPYPFTAAQLATIRAVELNNVICANSGIGAMQKIGFLVENNIFNQRVPCTFFPKMDVSLWKE